MSTVFGIGVRSPNGLHLLARVNRATKGIYYLIPRDAKAFDIDSNANWDPHVSYHVDGTFHVKSFDQRLGRPMQRQPFNSAFSGAEPLFAQAFKRSELLAHPVVSGATVFDAVLEIPIDQVALPDDYSLVIDLIAPGATRPTGPWRDLVLDHSFRDASPWILATLWRGFSVSDSQETSTFA